MKTQIIFFPKFDDVFTETDELARYVFLPLISITITDNPELSGKKFHVVSLWDTGNYEESYFNDYRQEIHWMRFDHIDNKYSYPAPVNFPSIGFLKTAYKIAERHFNDNIDFYLRPKEWTEFNELRDRKNGGAKIREQLPDMPVFDSEYYFGRIISYLLTKERIKKYLALNSKLTYAYYGDEGKTKEEVRENFNREGKKDLVSFIQKPEELKERFSPEWGQYEDQEFICHIDVGDFIHSDATMITLFYDKKQKQAIQLFSWD
jgi:hypothetical protein